MARVPSWAHLRASTEPGVSCSTCDYFERTGSTCRMFEHAPVEPGDTCDEWVHRVDKEGEPTAGTPAAFDHDEVKGMAELVAALEPNVTKTDVKAAGIAVRAADTGRVLMIQRALTDGDPAKGTWEFPGGNLNDGEHPYTGAKREWQEEMGARLPKGEHAGEWRSGVYHGFIHDVPSEDRVPLNRDHEDRKVMNPDDPDGDQIEVAAWFHPDQLKRMSSLRPELRASRPWRKVQKSDITAGPGTGVRQLIQYAAGELYLISHAKTRYNRPGQPHDIVHGWRNTPLDAAGHRQAKALGKFLKTAGIEELHTSDLARARQTADAIAGATGVNAKVDAKYRPWNLGDFAGHSSADVIPKLKPYMGEKSGQPVDGGESFDEFKGRFVPALEALLKKAEGGKCVALVTHSRNVELAQGWLEGKGHRSKVDTQAISEDRLDPATVIRVSRGRGGKMQMDQVADDTIRKAQARPAHLRLRVNGVSTTPAGMRVYRMVTRDGHYVGRTNATRVRARKGDVLKVQANDFLQDANGDLRWSNPNVVGAEIEDTPHSWRELEALAGGPLVKDAAPGPAGDLPSAEGDTPPARMPSGPTLESVHVPAPLPNISVAYANRRMIPQPATVFRVAKADKWKQLVYGVVLAPNELDSQNDFMLPDAVEKTAHGFLKRSIKGTNNVHKLQHRRKVNVRGGKPTLIPVESFIAPVDFTYDGKETIKKGSWVLVVHVEDAALWQEFLDGKYNAFSVGGTGVRRSMNELAGEIPGAWMRGQAEVYAGRIAARGLNSFV